MPAASASAPDNDLNAVIVRENACYDNADQVRDFIDSRAASASAAAAAAAADDEFDDAFAYEVGGGGGGGGGARFRDNDNDNEGDGGMEPVGGPDGPDEAPPPPERQYVSTVRLSDAVIAADTEPTDDENFCFRCVMGKRARNHGSSTHLDSLDELMRTQYMHLSPDELTRRVQNMYNTHLRNQIAGVEMRKPWRRRVIWEHIHVHAKDPEMETKYYLRVMSSTLHVLATEGLVYKGTAPNTLKVDAANLKLYAAMMKEYLRGLAVVSIDGPNAGGMRRQNKRSR